MNGNVVTDMKSGQLPFKVYKIAKTGKTRYLNVGALLPTDWGVVKVTIVKFGEGACVLRLEQIK